MFKVIDLILEYQINGEERVLIKIGEEIIASVVFSAGTAISSIIATKVALVLSAIDKEFGAVVGFFIFSGGVIISDWLANESKELVHFAYEYIYLPTKRKIKSLQNGFDYFLSGNWWNDFFRITLFSNDKNKQILQHELRNKYGDEVDNMDNFEKDYRMLLGHYFTPERLELIYQKHKLDKKLNPTIPAMYRYNFPESLRKEIEDYARKHNIDN